MLNALPRIKHSKSSRGYLINALRRFPPYPHVNLKRPPRKNEAVALKASAVNQRFLDFVRSPRYPTTASAPLKKAGIASGSGTDETDTRCIVSDTPLFMSGNCLFAASEMTS